MGSPVVPGPLILEHIYSSSSVSFDDCQSAVVQSKVEQSSYCLFFCRSDHTFVIFLKNKLQVLIVKEYLGRHC